MVWVKRKTRHINIDSDSKKAITEFTELPKCHKSSTQIGAQIDVHVWEGHNETGGKWEGLNNPIMPPS